MEDKRGEPWTVDDVDRLFVLLNQGLRKRDMSFYLLRTENAIRAKLWRIMKEHQRKKERFMDLTETTVRGWFMILTNKPLFTEIERDGYVIKNIGPNMIQLSAKKRLTKKLVNGYSGAILLKTIRTKTKKLLKINRQTKHN